MTNPTPMMAQYLGLKAEAEDCLLFYRMGDFFELFFDDARIAAQVLDIALTSRGEHDGEKIPMCGVPVHAATAYLQRLIKAGHRVAIAEQTETPAEAKARGGSKALLYPLAALEGAELIVDDRVMARAFKGEPRRALDHIENTAGKVTLRLIFDNPRDPDFDLDLWLAEDQLRRNSGSPGQAIQEARSWIARAEAILRRPPALQPLTPPPPVVRENEPDPEPGEDDEAELPF